MSVSTMRFGQRAQKVKVTAIQTEVVDDSLALKECQRKLKKAELRIQ